MPIRYSDINAKKMPPSDFVIRHYPLTIQQLLAIFLTFLLVILSIVTITIDKISLAILLFLALGSLGWYVIVLIQRSRDLVMATEFQNSLFASALHFNNKFCLIIRREGNIVYMDNAFRKMFPDLLKETHLSVANLLRHGRVDPLEAEQIYAAIERGVHDKIIFTIQGSDSRTHKLVMAVEPIVRPSGFILLRSREYVEQRINRHSEFKVAPPSLLNKANLTLFAYIMDKMNTGVYVVDVAGTIIYVNPALEQSLGYQEGEMAAGRFLLRDILNTTSTTGPSITISEEFEGEIILRKKEGGVLRTFVNQRVLHTENHNFLGCVALISDPIHEDGDARKISW